MTGFFEVISQLGGAAVIVAALSAWIGRLWADRILNNESTAHQQRLKELESNLRHQVDTQLARLQSELSTLKEKTLKAHVDKIACYSFAIDGASKLLADMSATSTGVKGSSSFQDAFAEFDRSRIRAYGHMALVAPQSVLDAYDALVGYFLDVNEGHEKADWVKARELALVWINAARTDIGVDPSPVSYRGTR